MSRGAENMFLKLPSSDSNNKPTITTATGNLSNPNTYSSPTRSILKVAEGKCTPVSSSDRFIPNRRTVDFDACHAELEKVYAVDENASNRGSSESESTASASVGSKRKPAINSILSPAPKRLLDVFKATSASTVSAASSAAEASTSNGNVLQESDESKNSFLFARKRSIGYFEDGYTRASIDSPSATISSTKRQKSSRVLPNAPYRTLDAPDLMDDYYLNLLHWGSNNILAVALQQSVYLWHPTSGKIEQIEAVEGNDYVTSIKWSNNAPNTIAIGTSSNLVQLWDASTLTKTAECTGHAGRVSSLSWNENVISSGGRDSVILHHDVRAPSNDSIAKYVAHTQEICGLTWSNDGRTLASGGNENYLCIWDAAISGLSRGRGPVPSSLSNVAPRHLITDHIAAVKALAWCPWQSNTLASGGGTADRNIKMWNAANGECVRSVDTGSQVCSIQWCDHNKELVSSHGFSDNQLILWKYPSMTKVKEFRRHTARVLHLAKSPDGSTICSASSDETLCFWNIFESGSFGRPTGSLGGSGGLSSSISRNIGGSNLIR